MGRRTSPEHGAARQWREVCVIRKTCVVGKGSYSVYGSFPRLSASIGAARAEERAALRWFSEGVLAKAGCGATREVRR